MSLCRLGFHDWEYIYIEDREAAWVQHQSRGRLTVCGNGLSDPVHQRCCMRCGKTEDTLTPFLKMREAERDAMSLRRKRAKELFAANSEEQ